MEYIKNAVDFLLNEKTAVTLGKFDGLHRGHKCLIGHVTAKKKDGLKAVVFTFDTPPQTFVKDKEQQVLTTNEEKVSVFEELGVDYVIEYPFTKEMMRMEPEEFLKKIVHQLNIKYIAVGKDFHFGYQRKGNYEKILACSETFGYEVDVLDKKQYENRDISSTYVREEIAEGNIEKANMLLGHEFFVQGVVAHGNEIGRTLSMPTVNIIPLSCKILPPFGVYISQITIDDKVYQGITNVGRKPTIEGINPIGVETHIFDFNEDVYGKVIKVSFLTFLRGEKKFDSVEQLKKQIEKDMQTARNFHI